MYVCIWLMSNKKYQNRYVTNIPFEKNVFDRVNELLPKGISISDEINAFLKERLEELEEQKKEVALPKGAIIYSNNKTNKLLLQTTLDIFPTREQVRETYQPLDIKEKSKFLERLNQVIVEVNTINMQEEKRQFGKIRQVLKY